MPHMITTHRYTQLHHTTALQSLTPKFSQPAPSRYIEKATTLTLTPTTVTPNVQTGIDYAFLEALPEELRAEVLEMHGAQVEAEAPPPAAATAQLPPAAAAPAAAAPAVAVPAATAPAAGGASGSGSVARPAPPAAAAAAAPSAGGSSAATDSGLDGLDPEFLAALPPDIRQEVLAQQVG